MNKTRAHKNEARPRGASLAARDFAASLRSLLEITKTVRTGADVDSVVDAIARVVAETLGFQTVVLNVYRPEWDDFCVATVHGNDTVARSAARLHLRLGELDASPRRSGSRARARTSSRTTRSIGRRTVGDRFVPAGEPAIEGPEGWHPNDELFVPLEDSEW